MSSARQYAAQLALDLILLLDFISSEYRSIILLPCIYLLYTVVKVRGQGGLSPSAPI